MDSPLVFNRKDGANMGGWLGIGGTKLISVDGNSGKAPS